MKDTLDDHLTYFDRRQASQRNFRRAMAEGDDYYGGSTLPRPETVLLFPARRDNRSGICPMCKEEVLCDSAPPYAVELHGECIGGSIGAGALVRSPLDFRPPTQVRTH